MAIREAARAAWVASRSDLEGEARQFVSSLLAPFDVSALTTRDVQVTEAFTLFVLCDTDDDVCVGARSRGDGWQVFVVEDSDGWTIISEPVKSLAHLHTLLPEPPAAIPAWEPQLAVKVGERYTYNGSTYEVVQAHTTQAGWEPPNVPALWVKVI